MPTAERTHADSHRGQSRQQQRTSRAKSEILGKRTLPATLVFISPTVGCQHISAATPERAGTGVEAK